MTKKNLHVFTPVSLFQKERLLFLFKDTIVYGSASAISRAFSLITFPILARFFSVSDYGKLDFLLIISGFLSTLLIFGQDSRKNTTCAPLLISVLYVISVIA